MNKFITKVFKSAGVNAKVSRDTESPRFKVVDNALTLEGLVTSDRYTMTIKDNKGKVVDNLSVSQETVTQYALCLHWPQQQQHSNYSTDFVGSHYH